MSIQTYNSLPVIGGDFTLGCTFMPQTESRRVTWENGDRIILFSQACWFYPECVDTVPYPSRFSLLADLSSGNLTITNLTKDDSNNYQCTVSSEFAADLETSGSSNTQVTTLLPGITVYQNIIYMSTIMSNWGQTQSLNLIKKNMAYM